MKQTFVRFRNVFFFIGYSFLLYFTFFIFYIVIFIFYLYCIFIHVLFIRHLNECNECVDYNSQWLMLLFVNIDNKINIVSLSLSSDYTCGTACHTGTFLHRSSCLSDLKECSCCTFALVVLHRCNLQKCYYKTV